MHVPTYGVSKTSTFPKKRLHFSWWAGALFFAAVTAIGRMASGSPKKNRTLYNKRMQQAPWAPPGWLFAPAWTINNIFLIRALLKLVNEHHKDEKEKQLIGLQVGIWAVFCTFGIVYFRKKSPLLAAIWTQTDAILALASVLIARKKDKKLAANYYPLLGWTTFASSVAWYQAATNRDAYLHLEPIADGD